MNQNDFDELKRIVLSELDACGYFIRDFDSELMKKNDPDWKPYYSRSFGEMLLDFAVLYNMEAENKNYKYSLSED